MREKKEVMRRISSVLLALVLCVTFMPAWAFADSEPVEQANDTVILNDATDSENTETPEETPEVGSENTEQAANDADTAENEGDTDAESETGDGEEPSGEDPEPADVEPAVDPADLAKSFTLDGISVQFKEDVCKVPAETSNITPGRVWLVGNKASMKVNWVNPGNMSAIDGVIILRATGTSKVFKEVKRVAFKTYEDGQAVINPKTAYTDTTAKTKNTAYTYRVISYFELDDVTYISHISKSDWAAGQTSASKLKNVTKATMNKKTASLQSKGTVTLKLTVPTPKTKYKPTSIRWTSSNKSIATVTSKGKVTAKAPGTATIRARMASGYQFTSKITVVGAFKPGTPTLKVDYATTSKIVLAWNKTKNATGYEVYKSNDGLHWDDPILTSKTTYTFTGLTKDHRYTFYVIARNVNKGLDADGNSKTYKAVSSNSNVLNQKAVLKLRATKVTNFPTKKTIKAGNTLKVTVKVAYPESRKATLQMKSGKKWTTKKTITLPKGTGTSKVTITFPSDWWKTGSSEWRLVIPKNKTASAYTTSTLKITATRRYQNPSSYVQIKNTIGKHGYSHYVAPILVNNASTKSDHIEALIKTAMKYKGNKYAQSNSGAPGKGIDESGLVIQACYGAGVDLWPISPSTRPYNCVPNIMKSKLAKVSYGTPTKNDFPNVYRGDLIFFSTSKGGTAISVAIYTGTGGVILADVKKGVVRTTNIMTLLDESKYYVVGVRRIFN